MDNITQIMGVLNVTPDSFSDGGRFIALDAAMQHAENMAHAGAAVIDIGGESTRPGAAPLSIQEELDRVIPVIEALQARVAVPLSIDTRHPAVMQAAIAAGASIINDVNALQAPGALAVACANPQVQVCLMHMQGEPQTMQRAPEYRDVVQEVTDFLSERIQACETVGIARERIIIDPGFGFGKTLAHNLALLRALAHFQQWAVPVLVGFSRKSMIGALTGKPVADRLSGGLALATLAALQGVQWIRTHDVAETVDVLRVIQAYKN